MSLPMTRVKTIMKTSDGVDQVSNNAIQIVAKAAEQLIKTLTKESFENAGKGKSLEYDHLMNVVHENSRYEFLEIIIPKKITVKEFLALKAKLDKQENGSGSDSETESSETSSSSEDE